MFQSYGKQCTGRGCIKIIGLFHYVWDRNPEKGREKSVEAT